MSNTNPDLNLSDVGFDGEDDPFLKGIRDLEKNWFSRAETLTTDLVSPIHDAAAKGNTTRLEGKTKKTKSVTKISNAQRWTRRE